MTDKARELLERCAFQLGNENMTYWNAGLVKEIEDFLSTPEPTQDEEPVAWTCQDELNALGTDVTCYMYAEPLVGENNIPLYLHPAPRKQDEEPVARLHITETDTYPVIDVEVLNGEMLQPSMSPINVYTIQQKPFVRLSEEEVNSLTYAPLEPYELICAVENRLAEKNSDR